MNDTVFETNPNSKTINTIYTSPDGKTICVSYSFGYTILQFEDSMSVKQQRILTNNSIKLGVTSCSGNLTVCSITSSETSKDSNELVIFDENVGTAVFNLVVPETIKNIVLQNNLFAFSTKSECRVFSINPPLLICQFRTSDTDFAPFDIVESGNLDNGLNKVYIAEESPSFSQSSIITTNSTNPKFIAAIIGRTPSTLRIIEGFGKSTKDISLLAHNHSITSIKLSNSGQFVATASIQGTIVRIFSTTTGDKIGEFRRGNFGTQIRSLAFSSFSDYLAICSEKTVHICQVPISGLGSVTQKRSDLLWQADLPGISSISFLNNNIFLVIGIDGNYSLLKGDWNTKTIIKQAGGSILQLL